MRHLFLILAAFVGLCRLAAGGNAVASVQVEGGESDNFQYADFSLWRPNSQVSRLLVVSLGTNQNGLSLVDDPGWRSLAASLNCGLVTCFFASADGHWDAPEQGSGRALLEGIARLAARTDSPELSKSGLFLVGSSQGGQFAYHFAGWKPDRVLGFVSIKGGFHDVSWAPGAAKVPGLFILGLLDMPFRIENITQTFRAGRVLGAPWCLAAQPRARHEPGTCGPLVADFLQAIVSKRAAASDDTLKAGETVPVHAGREPDDSWFPSPLFRNQWKLFETTGLPGLSPPLSFESKAAPQIATCDPLSIVLPAVPSGGDSSIISLQVIPTTSNAWDDAMILPRSYLREITKTGSPGQSTTFSFLFNAGEKPIGRFNGAIPIRFTLHGLAVPGGVNVGLSAGIEGDVACHPPFIYLGAKTGSKIDASIKIVSKSGTSIQFVSCEGPPGVRLQVSSQTGNPLVATVSFDRSVPRYSSGILLLRLKSNREWVLRLPYFGADVSRSRLQ